MNPTVTAAAAAIALLPRDLSPWGMFQSADTIVRGVIILLALASVATWTIFLAKGVELILARRALGRAATRTAGARLLAEAEPGGERDPSPIAAMAAAARAELRVSAEVEATEHAGIKERVQSRLARLESGAARRIARGTGLLATIGATGPFVGLFGTVWGIMNSFVGISKAQTTNLAVVAPGIAEALMATAAGLVAAIPAVVIYNLFSRGIADYRARLADGAAMVERLASRELDRPVEGKPRARLKAAE